MTDTPPPRTPEDDDRTAAWPTQPAGASPGPGDDEPRYGQRLPGYGTDGPAGPAAPYGDQQGPYGASDQYPQQGSYGGQPGQYGQPYPGQGYGQPYPQAGYGAPYGGYPGYQPRLPRGAAIGSLVCGLVALVTFCIPLLPVVLGLIALGLGVMTINRVRQGRGAGRGMAVTGMVSGTIGLLLGIVMLVTWISFRPYFDQVVRCAEESPANQQQCIQRVIDRWAAQR